MWLALVSSKQEGCRFESNAGASCASCLVSAGALASSHTPNTHSFVSLETLQLSGRCQCEGRRPGRDLAMTTCPGCNPAPTLKQLHETKMIISGLNDVSFKEN